MSDGIVIGQRWEDKDRREVGREVVVIDLDARYAYCATEAGRQTRILRSNLLRRFRLLAVTDKVII